MSIEDPVDLDQQPQPTSPGEVLSNARQNKGLSQKEVADKLHITVHYVRSIEQDAYEKLPGTIFARGYIKRYGEILGLNAEDLLTTFEAFQQEQLDQQNEVTRIHARKNRARNRNFAIVSVVLFAGLFLGLWGWNTLMVDEIPLSTSTSAGSAASVSTPEPDRSASANTPAAIPNVTIPASETVQSPVQNSLPASGGTEVGPDPDATDVTNHSLVQQDAEPSIKIISIANEGDDVLRISFDDESFIQVSDGNSNRIYRGTLGKGEVLEITDKAPFNVLLGDAPFTHLIFNGTEIDVSDSIRIDNSARLTVGL